jgi:hypothetical protein
LLCLGREGAVLETNDQIAAFLADGDDLFLVFLAFLVQLRDRPRFGQREAAFLVVVLAVGRS